MITPLFECQQDDKTVTVLVRAPHSRPRDVDISVIDKDLHFHCHPYLLHMRFPHPLTLDPENNPANYNIATGIATIPLLKSVSGQYFERLDMLSTLLITRKKADFATGRHPAPGPNIEVLSSEDVSTSIEHNSSMGVNTMDDTAQPRASEKNPMLPAMRADSILLVDASKNFRENVTDVAGVEVAMSQLSVGRPKYGFGARYEGIFHARAEDISEIVELPAPDTTPVWRRPQLRRQLEDEKFDPEHYVADFMLVDEFAHVIHFFPTFNLEDMPLSNSAKDVMLKLPRREYLKDIDRDVSADLAGLLYAFCYDHRTTCGEGNVESAWTISRLCASFSCLEAMHSAHSAIFAAYRRSLAYPLYRNTTVADLTLADMKRLVDCAGDVGKLRSRLLRLLVNLRQLFEEEKLLRIFSDIFLTDFCVWIQFVDDDVLRKLSEDVLNILIDKSTLGWDLFGLERAALDVQQGILTADMEPTSTQIGEEVHLLSGGVLGPSPDIVIRSSQPPGFEITPASQPPAGSTSLNPCLTCSSSSSSCSSSSDESSESEASALNDRPLPASNATAVFRTANGADELR